MSFLKNSRQWVFGLSAAFLLLACGLIDLGTSTPPDCEQSLDQETVNRLTLSLGVLSGAKQLQPGDTYDYEVGVTECCYSFEEVPACVNWRIEPESGAEIDPITGVFHVNEDTPSGTVYTVEADVTHDGGRLVISDSVTIYSPGSNPLVGLWTERAQRSCENTGETEFTPKALIGEMQFTADGNFSVTWYPFEVYRDYWGTYTYDLDTGALVLTITGGNYVPEGIDSSGFFTFDESGRLVLADIWLGSPPDGAAEPSCGHIFD